MIYNLTPIYPKTVQIHFRFQKPKCPKWVSG